MQVFTSSTYKEEPTEDLALPNWEASFTTKEEKDEGLKKYTWWGCLLHL